jgi:hypothetical protein
MTSAFEPTPYEPPPSMREFVRILQGSTPEDAADVLRLAFANAAATAVLEELHVRNAAPALLAACMACLRAVEAREPLDWQILTDAVAKAQHLAEVARA